VTTALYLFFVCCNVKFAPWEWDNTKLMVWAWIIILPFVWEPLISQWPLVPRALACVLLFFSGFVSLIGGINSRHEGHAIAQLSALDAVNAAVRPIPVTATFAAAPAYNHPLLLCGRKLLMGYEGHLASHGIDYLEARSNLDVLMNGGPDWRTYADRLGARYVFFGPLENERWPASSRPWESEAVLVASGAWGGIFDLTGPPSSAEAAPAVPRFR
jgi:hypothetical protein